MTTTMHTDKKIKLTLLIIAALTIATGYAVIWQSNVDHALLPAERSVYPWRAYTSTDATQGGSSSIDLRDSTYNLNFDFKLSSEPQYPFATVGMTFDDDTQPERLLDWSNYSMITLLVKCRPDNVLSFVLHTYDDQITKFPDIESFRPSTAFFTCSDEWQKIQINLHRLETPEWWLRQHNLNLSNREYPLTKVRGYSFATSPQSLVGSLSNVAVAEITLSGRNWTLIYSAIAIELTLWAGILYWAIPQLLLIRRTMQPSTTVVPVPYQPVTTDSKHDRHKSAVLDYLATHYVNPDLSVDTVVNALGLNRGKINDILREQTDLTFSTYLNKLRLTEAARLLSEKHMSVAETAFAVGYSSLSYFNRAFKKEYGCTPSSYKSSPDIAPHSASESVNNPQK